MTRTTQSVKKCFIIISKYLNLEHSRFTQTKSASHSHWNWIEHKSRALIGSTQSTLVCWWKKKLLFLFKEEVEEWRQSAPAQTPAINAKSGKWHRGEFECLLHKHVRKLSAEDQTNNSFFRMDVSWLHKKRMQKCWIAFRNCSCDLFFMVNTVRLSAARIEKKSSRRKFLFICFNFFFAFAKAQTIVERCGDT